MSRHSLVFFIALLLSFSVLVAPRTLHTPRRISRLHMHKRHPQDQGNGDPSTALPAAASSADSNSAQNAPVAPTESPSPTSNSAVSVANIAPSTSVDTSETAVEAASSTSSTETLVVDTNVDSSSASGLSTATSNSFIATATNSLGIHTPGSPSISAGASVQPGKYPTLTPNLVTSTFTDGPAPTGTNGVIILSVSTGVLTLGFALNLVLI